MTTELMIVVGFFSLVGALGVWELYSQGDTFGAILIAMGWTAFLTFVSLYEKINTRRS